MFRSEPSWRILADRFLEVSAQAAFQIRFNSSEWQGLTVIPTVKYPYTYLIVSLLSHKFINHQ
jgi:hypothetical protein